MRRLAVLSPLARALMGIASVLASLSAVGCALAGRAWPGVVCVLAAGWFAARVWRDDVRRSR